MNLLHEHRRFPQEVADRPQEIDPHYLAESVSELASAQRELARILVSQAKKVDEYVTQGPQAVSVASLQVQPQFELLAERIRHVIIVGPSATTLAPLDSSGTVTNPSAGATIATIAAPPAGQYQAYWEAGLEGTVTAADADNMRLNLGSLGIERASYPGVVGEYPQPTVQFTADGVNPVKVVALSLASGASAIYNATISLIPINVSIAFTLQLGDRYWPLTLPSTGLMEFGCDLLLTRTDIRKLTSNVAGNWFFELTGEADERNRY